MLNITLPWPPSANRYWRNIKGRTLVSKEAKLYKMLIKGLSYEWKMKPMLGRIGLQIEAYPPDKRIRDLDNTLKVLIDSLKETGVFKDDSQIDKICITRLEPSKPGHLKISISEIGAPA